METKQRIASILIALAAVLGFASCDDDLIGTPAWLRYSADTTSVAIEWPATAGAASYNVELREKVPFTTVPDYYPTSTYNTSETRITIDGLQPETTYEFRVLPVNTDGATDGGIAWSEVTTLEANYARRFAAGEGTESSPYIIETTGQLMRMALMVDSMPQKYAAAHYRLADNINLDGRYWIPIGRGRGNASLELPTEGAFKGTLDGDGHSIYNLTVTAKADEPVACYGLFGLTDSATIKNLTVKADIHAENNTQADGTQTATACGGITGAAMHTLIDNCRFEGSVSCRSDVESAACLSGGIAGSLTGDIKNSTATIPSGGKIEAAATFAQAGGMVGYANAGMMESDKATVAGAVSATSGAATTELSAVCAGGLVGNSFGGTVANSAVSVGGTIAAKSVLADAGGFGPSAAAGGLAGAYSADACSGNAVSLSGSITAEGQGGSSAGGVVGSQQNAGYGASNLTATIEATGSVRATDHGREQSSQASAGGVYGRATFQTNSALLSGCTAAVAGTVEADAQIAAFAGGVAGNAGATLRDMAHIAATGKVSARGASFTACGGVAGNALGSSWACCAVIDGQLSASAAEESSQAGGVFGAMAGNRMKPRTATACYALVGGSIAGGNGTSVGALTGAASSMSQPKASFWWASGSSLSSAVGNIPTTEGRMAARDIASLTAAMEAMNEALAASDHPDCAFTLDNENTWLVPSKQ